MLFRVELRVTIVFDAGEVAGFRTPSTVPLIPLSAVRSGGSADEPDRHRRDFDHPVSGRRTERVLAGGRMLVFADRCSPLRSAASGQQVVAHEGKGWT